MSAEITKAQAEAVLHQAEVWTGDGGSIEMASREDAATLLTLARAGAAVLFPGEEASALLPCPFCGSDAKHTSHHQDTGGGDGRRIHVVGCHNPECLILPQARGAGPHGYRKDGDLPDNEAALAVAIKRWNTRAAIAAMKP